MKKYLYLTVLCIFLAASAGSEGSYAYKKVLRVSDARVISFEEMIGELRKVDMVFVGEEHGNVRDHQAELDIVTSLRAKVARMAIGMEMFRADSQKTLDAWTKGSLDQGLFIQAYYNNWRMPWPNYRDILLFARDRSVPIIGLNVPDQISEKVASKGFGSLSREELAKLPPGISCDIDRSYMDFIRQAYAAHGKGEDSFVHFCEAQMVWDKAMAWRLIEYLKKNPGKEVVVIAGVGHSWKRGIPEQIRRVSRYTFKVILPEVPGKTMSGSVTTGDADYILLR